MSSHPIQPKSVSSPESLSPQGLASTSMSRHETIGPVQRPPFVVISRFTVANDMTTQVKESFRNRPHKVDFADGFLHMNVISPIDEPDEIWLLTFWRDEPSYTAWHRSHHYRESHSGIPKGLKVVPKSANIRCFEFVSQ